MRPLHRKRHTSCIFLIGAIIAFGLSAAPVADGASAGSNGYFQHIDANNDGRIDRDEYTAWMMYAFRKRDHNQDSVLQGAELPPGTRHPILASEYTADLMAQFTRQDRNHDGYLSAKEWLSPP